MNKKFALSMLFVALFGVTTASAVDLIDVDGDWDLAATVGGVNPNLQSDIIAYGNGDQDQIRWGVPYKQPNQSGLGFTGVVDSGMTAVPITIGSPFEIGQLVHFNFEQGNGTSSSQTEMDLFLEFADAALTGSTTLGLTFLINETPGIGTPDIITFPAGQSENVALDGTTYKFTFLGFGEMNGGLTLEDQFVSEEGGESTTYLYGQLSEISLIPAPGALLLGSLGAGLVGLVRGRKRV